MGKEKDKKILDMVSDLKTTDMLILILCMPHYMIKLIIISAEGEY